MRNQHSLRLRVNLEVEVKGAIYDPACGTGGFLLAAYEYLSDRERFDLDNRATQFLRLPILRGKDVVEGVVRLCAMNLYLHCIGGEESPIVVGDSLISYPDDHYDLVLKSIDFHPSATTFLESWPNENNQDLNYHDIFARTALKRR